MTQSWEQAKAENAAAWKRSLDAAADRIAARGLPRTWTAEGITYHEAFGKRSTFWIACPDCGKRQPAGTETLTAYGGEQHTRVERLYPQWAKPQIGRCAECYARGPLVEITLAEGRGTRQQGLCDRRCLDAAGDECNCGVCTGKCHGAGKCYCDVATNDQAAV